MDRRRFFGAIAGLATLPIINKLPVPIATPIRKIGTWAEIKSGKIISVTISPGAGYSSSPVSLKKDV